MKASSGVLTEEDFGNYSTVLQQPAESNYQGALNTKKQNQKRWQIGYHWNVKRERMNQQALLQYDRKTELLLDAVIVFCFIAAAAVLGCICRSPRDDDPSPTYGTGCCHRSQHPWRLQHNKPDAPEQHLPQDCRGHTDTVSRPQYCNILRFIYNLSPDLCMNLPGCKDRCCLG